ncbi:MAG: 30S ribosomal protein S6 [Phycisphaerae bacterium]
MTKTYEAMFLMNPAVAPEWTAGEAEIRRILERAEAKVLGLKRWDERKLAYEIGGHKRGTYGLVFFEADGAKVLGIERDAVLSEAVLRLLVLRMDCPTPEKIEKMMTAAASRPYEGRGDHGPRDFGDGDRRGGPPRDGAPREGAPREPAPAMEPGEPVGA